MGLFEALEFNILDRSLLFLCLLVFLRGLVMIRLAFFILIISQVSYGEPLGVSKTEGRIKKSEVIYKCDSNTQQREVIVKYLKNIDEPPCEVHEIKRSKGVKAKRKKLYRG